MLESSIDFGSAGNAGQGVGVLTSAYSSRQTSVQGSRTASRSHSRPGSKPPSRPGSRSSSRPGSRQGSNNQLDQLLTTTIYASPTRDPVITLGQRNHSSGCGFQGHHSHSETNHNQNYATVGRSGGSSPVGYSVPLNPTQGYNEGGAAVYSNGTVPKSHSKSFDQNSEKIVSGNSSNFTYSMSYQHHSSASSTLPRNPPVQMMGAQVSHLISETISSLFRLLNQGC